MIAGRAARRAGVRRIIYLGGLGDNADALSTHLKSRAETGEALRDSGVPGFVIVGEEDELSPHEDAVAMAKAFVPQAPVYVIPGAGHLSAVENPDGVTGALRDVLRHLQRS